MSEDIIQETDGVDIDETLPQIDKDETKNKVWIVYDIKIHGVFKNDTKAEKLRRKHSCKKSLFTIS